MFHCAVWYSRVVSPLMHGVADTLYVFYCVVFTGVCQTFIMSGGAICGFMMSLYLSCKCYKALQVSMLVGSFNVVFRM